MPQINQILLTMTKRLSHIDRQQPDWAKQAQFHLTLEHAYKALQQEFIQTISRGRDLHLLTLLQDPDFHLTEWSSPFQDEQKYKLDFHGLNEKVWLTKMQAVLQQQKHLGTNTITNLMDAMNTSPKEFLQNHFQSADLRKANFQFAKLAGINLKGANLAGVDFRNADLRDACLAGADLRGAKLDYANLAGADLRGAKLDYANLTSTFLVGVKLDGASLRHTWLDHTRLYYPPEKLIAESREEYLARQNLGLYPASMKGVDLSGAFITYTSAQGVDFSPLNGQATNLDSAHLSDVQGWETLKGADVHKIRFDSVDKVTANFNPYGAHNLNENSLGKLMQAMDQKRNRVFH